jgi:hypothetical protein
MAGAGQIPGAGNADDATTEDENLHDIAPGKFAVNLPLGDIAILWQVIWSDFSFILPVTEQDSFVSTFFRGIL